MKFKAVRSVVLATVGLSLFSLAGCQRSRPPADDSESSDRSLSVGPTDEDLRKLSEIFKPAQDARDVFFALIRVRENFAVFRISESEFPLSRHSDAQLLALARPMSRASNRALTHLRSTLTEELRENLRRDYSDTDLEQLKILGEMARAAAEKTQAAAIAAMDANPELLAKVENFPQFAFLKLLRATRGMPATQTAKAFESEARRLSGRPARVPGDLSPSFTDELLGGPAVEEEGDLFHPWGVLSFLPTRGSEGRRVSVGTLKAGLSGLFAYVRGFSNAAYFSKQSARYRQLRSRDEPTNLFFQPCAADAVTVAILGSGVDYVDDPALGRYLAPASNAGFASYDFADDNDSPWAPRSESAFRDGSDGASVFWETLGKVDASGTDFGAYRYGVWKTSSLRRLLPSAEPPTRERTAMAEALIHAIESAPATQPRILLISEPANGLYGMLADAGRASVLRKAPWLWVMAAGTGPGDMEQAEPAPCFVEFAAEERPSKRLLCVGSVVVGDKGEVRIAGHSNRGEGVDVYSPERNGKDHPSGAAYSAPVIAAVAALLLKEYPGLSAEQLKSVIVGSAVERDEGPLSSKVRVWDPEDAQSLPRARQLAEKFLKESK